MSTQEVIERMTKLAEETKSFFKPEYIAGDGTTYHACIDEYLVEHIGFIRENPKIAEGTEKRFNNHMDGYRRTAEKEEVKGWVSQAKRRARLGLDS